MFSEALGLPSVAVFVRMFLGALFKLLLGIFAHEIAQFKKLHLLQESVDSKTLVIHRLNYLFSASSNWDVARGALFLSA